MNLDPISIMAEAGTETAVETPATPSLGEAYKAGRDSDNNLVAEGKRKPEERTDTTLGQESDARRETAREQPKPRREPTLAQALNNEQPDEAEEFSLPSEFSQFAADDIEACLGLMGMTESDMQRPELAALVLKELEASFPKNSDEDDGEEDDSDPEVEESEEDEDEKKEEKKPEEENKPPVDPKANQQHAEIPVEELVKHSSEVWDRAQQLNHPQATDIFVRTLAGALETPPESMDRLRQVVGTLQWGAQSIIESAVPALVHSYMQANFGNVLENHLPGFHQGFTDDMLSRTWDAVRGNDLPAFGTPEFKELAEEIHEKHPFLNDIDFKDSKGKSLPIRDALRAKAELTARLCRGERVTPQAIADAVARGRADATKSNRRVSVSRSLGGGRTTGKMAPAEEPATSLYDAFTAHHGEVV